ncbi:MAG: hypothetical protein L6N96_00875 [Candidatus Methylarchaceae archaeon HK02M2]|nr:hypothetical protein [Candidatus Methylarchaceae archaeon HK02M2]
MSDKEKKSEAYRLLLLPGIPLSIIEKIAKEFHLNIVEEEVYTKLEGEANPIKKKILAFESVNKENLEKARRNLVENLAKRIKDISKMYES